MGSHFSHKIVTLYEQQIQNKREYVKMHAYVHM